MTMPNGHSNVAAKVEVLLLSTGEIKVGFENVNVVSALGMLEVGKAQVAEFFAKQAQGSQIIPVHGAFPNLRG